MNRQFFIYLVFSLFLLPIAWFSVSAEVVYQLDFSKEPDGNALKWFKNNDFNLQRDADELISRFENGKLIIETRDDINGIFYKEVNLKKAKRIRIEWGILQYPEGADWEKGVYREAIGVVITFGKKKISSGSFVVPNVPYFIGIFLGEHEPEGKAYTGNYYKKGGRYFCLPCNSPVGKTIITEFDLEKNFKEQFHLSTIPPITGLAIEADTRDTRGFSKAFLRKIEFLSE